MLNSNGVSIPVPDVNPTYCVAIPDETFDAMEAKRISRGIVYRMGDLWQEAQIRHYLAFGSLHVIFMRQSDFPVKIPTPDGVTEPPQQPEVCTLEDVQLALEKRKPMQEMA
mgnify:CR=1 FL=1